MKMQESAQMYLETILVLSEKGTDPRAIDIANRLGFSRPSVSIALKDLAEDGYIKIDENKRISLTRAGNEEACKMLERHLVLSELFRKIGVGEEAADEDACRIEHYISEETFEAIKALNKKL